MLLNDFYTIESFEQQDKQVDAVIKIDKTHEIFKGHFPTKPVTPGVCIIQIVKELAEKALDERLFMQKASNIKFKSLINPEENDTLNMQLALKEEGELIKVKNTTGFDGSPALTMNVVYRRK